jgi:hypothetical protein
MRRHAAGASGFIAPEEERHEAFVMHRIGDLGVTDKPGLNDAMVRTTAALHTGVAHVLKNFTSPNPLVP